MTVCSNHSLETLIEWACVLEATARKAGNVHPWTAFDDVDYAAFVRSARAIRSPLANTASTGIGPAVLAAVHATQQVTATNTNLGIILVLAPLASAVGDGLSDREPGTLVSAIAAAVESKLQGTTVDDAVAVYAAIRAAKPGGLGAADQADVHDQPTQSLREVMALARSWDLIAEQYASGYAELLKLADEWWQRTAELPAPRGIPLWERRLLWLQLRWMAAHGDTLIARKCGATSNQAARDQATLLLESWPTAAAEEGPFLQAWQAFDAWLRADGHRRNPGTTADSIAGCVLVELLDPLRRQSWPTLEGLAKWSRSDQGPIPAR